MHRSWKVDNSSICWRRCHLTNCQNNFLTVTQLLNLAPSITLTSITLRVVTWSRYHGLWNKDFVETMLYHVMQYFCVSKIVESSGFMRWQFKMYIFTYALCSALLDVLCAVFCVINASPKAFITQISQLTVNKFPRISEFPNHKKFRRHGVCWCALVWFAMVSYHLSVVICTAVM